MAISTIPSTANTTKPKLVLITGGLGYIGSHVVVALLLTGQYLPVVFDNCANAYPEALKRCARIAKQELGEEALQPIFEQGDLRDPAQVDAVFAKYAQHEAGGIWAVIHLAALKAVGESGEKPVQYYQVNVAGSLNLLESMEKHSTANLVFSSSATVYGEPSTIPIPETSPIVPMSVYGRSKGMVERIIQDACIAGAASGDGSALRAVSVRYFNPAGAHPSAILGEEPRGRPGNLLPILAQMATGRLAPDLKVYGDDYPTHDGTCVRDYLHVMDLAEGHINALDALLASHSPAGKSIFSSLDVAKEGRFRAFNLGRGKGLSVLDMISAMKSATGFDYAYEIVGRRNGDVPDLTADPALAQKELGFVAKRDLDEMCRDLWRFQTANANGYEVAQYMGDRRPGGSASRAWIAH